MELTQTQMKRSNKVMLTMIITFCIVLMGSNLLGVITGAQNRWIGLVNSGLFLAEIIAVIFVFRVKWYDIRYIYVVGIFWIICASVAVFFTPVNMTYITSFVVAAVSVVYMDKKLLYIMNLGSCICLLPAVIIQDFINDSKTAEGGFILGVPLILSIGMIKVGNLFIAFNRENQEVLKEKISIQHDTMENISDTTEKVNDIFKTVLSDLEVINDEIEQNKSSMDAVSQSMQSTAAEIQNQVKETNSIQETISQTEERTQKVRDTSGNVLEIVEEGVEISREVLKQSKVVDENTGKMTQTIQELLKHVDDVSAITESIIEISSETNLLALNASIEAARAGEAGKGFAVVAEQIRILSENTGNAISRISDIIKKLSEASQNTMKILDESVESIRIQGENVDKVGEHFIETGNAMNTLNQLLEKIREDVKILYSSNQSIVAGAENLSANTDQINTISTNGVEISNRMMERMEAFNQKINEVNTIVGKLSQRKSE